MARVTSDQLLRLAQRMLQTDEVALNVAQDVFVKTGNRIDETDNNRLETVRTLIEEATKLATLEAAERFDKRVRADWKDAVERIILAGQQGQDVVFPRTEESKITRTH